MNPSASSRWSAGNSEPGLTTNVPFVICALFVILIIIGLLAGDSTSTGTPSGVPA